MKDFENKKKPLNLDFFYQSGAIVVGILLSVTLVRNILVISSANQKIEKIKNEIADIESKNNHLKVQLEKTSREEFLEEQARNKLGLIREGEVVIVLPDEETLKQFSPKIPEEEVSLPDPNWKKWLKLFM